MERSNCNISTRICKHKRGDFHEIHGPVWCGGRGYLECAVRIADHVNDITHVPGILIGAREARSSLEFASCGGVGV